MLWRAFSLGLGLGSGLGSRLELRLWKFRSLALSSILASAVNFGELADMSLRAF